MIKLLFKNNREKPPESEGLGEEGVGTVQMCVGVSADPFAVRNYYPPSWAILDVGLTEKDSLSLRGCFNLQPFFASSGITDTGDRLVAVVITKSGQSYMQSTIDCHVGVDCSYEDDEESAGVLLVEEGEVAALEIELDHVLGSWSWNISGRKTVR
ncbi:hypothetical protein quinque_005413 [Culex quinquefasciatus]